MQEIKAYRADGWPLCPQCENDELYSLLNWNGEGERPPLSEWIAAGLRCYCCWWSTFGVYSSECARAMSGEKVPNIPSKDTPKTT